MSKATHEASQGSFKSYLLGFVLSIALTLDAYWAVVHRTLPLSFIVASIVGLAIVQLLVQLVFFLHLDRESKPRWNLTIFGFMLIIVGILVGGSLWIMHNLDYSHARNTIPKDVNTYIIKDEGIQK